MEGKFLCAGKRTKKEAEEGEGQASRQRVCPGQVLSGQENCKKNSSPVTSSLCSSFLTKRGRRLSIFPQAADNLLLNLWNGHLPANLPVSGPINLKINHRILLSVPRFHPIQGLCPKSTEPKSSPLFPVSFACLFSTFFPNPFEILLILPLEAFFLCHIRILTFAFSAKCISVHSEFFLFGVPSLDEKLEIKTSTYACGSLKNPQYKG